MKHFRSCQNWMKEKRKSFNNKTCLIIKLELHSNFTLNVHVVTNSFTLLLRSDLLQTMQHITVKYILYDNNFCRVTFDKQLGISNFD